MPHRRRPWFDGLQRQIDEDLAAFDIDARLRVEKRRIADQLSRIADQLEMQATHVAIPAAVDPRQPDPPTDDALDPPATALVPTRPKRKPSPQYFIEADNLLAVGIDPEDPHCWSLISARVPKSKRSRHYYIDQVRLAMKWRAFERASQDARPPTG